MPELSALARAPGAAATARPEIPLPKLRWKTRVLIPGALLTCFGAILAVLTWDSFWPAVPVRATTVVVKAGGQAGGGIAFQSAGWIEPAPYPIYVSALTDGVVESVPVLEGQAVEAGDVVVRLVATDAQLAWERADAACARRSAALKTAEAVLAGAQRDWDNPIARQLAVESAASLVAENEALQVQLERELAVQHSRAAELEEMQRREASAAAANAIPEFQLVRTQLQLKTEQARAEAIQAQQGVVAAKLAKARAELHAAREHARLRSAERRELDEAQAQLALAQAELQDAEVARREARLRLERMEVRAPVAGVVMNRLTSPGSKLILAGDLSQSAQAVVLYNPRQLQVRADIPLADAAKITLGQRARVSTEALPERSFDGTLVRVVHSADVQKNTLQVKVLLDDPAPELKPEMLARIQFLAPDRAAPATVHRLFAPQRALEISGRQATAWVLDKSRNVALHRALTLGEAGQDGWIEVLSGLHPGDALLESPTPLGAGLRVRVVAEPHAGNGGTTHGAD